MPLSTPSRPFQTLAIDQIIGLSKSQGFDAILVVANRLTKYCVFIPPRTTDTAEDLANQLDQQVFSLRATPTRLFGKGTMTDIHKFGCQGIPSPCMEYGNLLAQGSGRQSPDKQNALTNNPKRKRDFTSTTGPAGPHSYQRQHLLRTTAEGQALIM